MNRTDVPDVPTTLDITNISDINCVGNIQSHYIAFLGLA